MACSRSPSMKCSVMMFGPDSPAVACSGFETHADDVTPFHGRNKWPGAEQCPGFRETMEAYYKAMHGVALR